MAEEDDKPCRLIFFAEEGQQPGMRLEATNEEPMIYVSKKRVRIVLPMDDEKILWLMTRALEFAQWRSGEGPEPQPQETPEYARRVVN